MAADIAATLGRPLSGPAKEERDGRLRWVDVAIIAGYLLAALAVYARLWVDLDHRYLVDSGQDQRQWEWFFAVVAKNVTELQNPLFTTLQNQPLGVNLMGNTAMLGLAIPLTPVTLVFGPTVTWAVVLTAGLAGTAAAWYWVLSRHIARSRPAAAVGAGFCAFAPPFISHANAHPNFVVLFVVPLIVAQLIRLCAGRHVTRDGIVLGLLVAFQIFLGEEALLLAATALGLYAIAYAVMRPATARTVARPLLTGLGVAALTSLALVAYPLWWQFFGPQSYRSLLHGPAGNDVAALAAYADRSLAGGLTANMAGGAGGMPSLSINPTEENAFFGPPLIGLFVAITIGLWRSVQVRALALVTLAAALFSLGPEIIVMGRPTGINGPWLFMSGLPFYGSVLESRWTLVSAVAVGILLAIATERVLALAREPGAAHTTWRLLWLAVLVVALVPLAPKPLRAADRPPTPRFFLDGTWRQYVAAGRSLVPVPVPDAGGAQALRWQLDAGLGFSVPEGYFVGPYGADHRGVYGAVPRPTATLLRHVLDSGKAPPITAAQHRAMREDLRFWRADAVVLGPHPAQDALRSTLDRLLGTGRYVGDVWVWDVRGA